MNLRHIICQALCPKQKPFRFENADYDIFAHEIVDIIEKAYPDAELRISDRMYIIPPYSELIRWLNTDSLNEMRYLKTVSDCDDFALESRCRIRELGRINNVNYLYAYCEGCVPAGYHAFNLTIRSEDMQIIIIEPQNDETMHWKQSDYKPDFIQF